MSMKPLRVFSPYSSFSDIFSNLKPVFYDNHTKNGDFFILIFKYLTFGRCPLTEIETIHDGMEKIIQNGLNWNGMG